MELYQVYQAKIAECDREIEAQIERCGDHGGGGTPAEHPGKNRIQDNAPRSDVPATFMDDRGRSDQAPVPTDAG